MFQSVASNLIRLEIEIDKYVKNIVFATTCFHLVAGKKATQDVLNFEGCIALYS